MTVSNWDKAKRQFKAGLPAFMITAGVIFLLSAFIGFWNGSIDYRMQLEQTSWPTVNAAISFVEEQTEHSMTPGHYGHTSTYYDIHYNYAVDGQIYTGVIEGRNRYSDLGDSFEIKYNPDAPEQSTYILEPSKAFLVSGSIFGGAGLLLVIFSVVLAKKLQQEGEKSSVR